MLTRRRLLAGASAASVPATAGAPLREAQAQPPARARMYLGHQHDHSENTLRALAAFGVPEICSGQVSPQLDESWSVDGLTRLRKHVESFGLRLAMVPLPLSSRPIARAEHPHLLLGQSPERDREIEDLRTMIRNAGKAGIPAVKYNFTLLGVVRTEPTLGRGGARYSTFVYDQAKQDPPLTEAGPVDEAEYWRRITYFLERVVPVAEEAKVRIACHPQDPGMPKGKGFRGIHPVLGSVEGLKRFVEIQASPYHGLNFCQGTVCEMLKKPGEEIFDVIRYFGQRKKIFNVHFRNIAGGFLNFRETFPDNGDIDMLKALRTYREVGYEGMIMPDHVPTIEGDEGRHRAFAYAFGYIQALLKVVESA